MKRVLLTAAVLAFGATAVMAQQEVAVQQQNLMKSMGRAMYGTINRAVKGDAPYDQAAIDAALATLEQDTGKIAKEFATNPKEDVVNATFGASQKIWQDKAGFDAKIPPVAKAIADVKGKVTDVASLKVAFDSINAKCTSCHEDFRVKLK
jgi:cytochrome c556